MTVKSRDSSVDITTSWVVNKLSPPGVYASGGGTTSYQQSQEYIHYTNGFGRYNACLHYRARRTFENEPATFIEANSNLETTSDAYLNYYTLTGGINRLKQVSDGYWDKDEFIARAIQAMTPTLESGFEVTQFLYEIKEIANLWKWWKFGKSLWRNFSAGNLNYAFGLLPFISDCKNLYKGLRTLDERLLALKRGAGQVNVRHYSEVAKVPSSTQSEVVGSAPFDIKHFSDRSYPEGVRYTATMRYTYQFPEIDRARAKLRALLDTIGAHLDLYSLWNIIPFSFVVDWFIDVGGFLKQFREMWVPVHLYVKEFGASSKVIAQDINSCIRGYSGISPSLRVGQDSTDYSYYHRFPVTLEDKHFDVTWSTSPTSGLTLRKLFLGGLLLEQRIH